MSDFDLPRGKLDIGKLLQDLFAVLGRNFLTFFVLALILVGLPSAIVGFLQNEALAGGDVNRGVGLVLGVLVSVASGAVLQGALMHGTVADMNSRKLSVGESLAVGLRAFLPLIGIGILMAIALFFGFLLLIVPGVMMALAWCVTTPAYVAENRGVFASFERSAVLTRGNRWRILGLALIYIVAAIVIAIVLGTIGGIATLAGGGGALIEAVLVNPLSNTLSTVIGATGGAVLYVELRRLREGLGPESLAAIFD